MDFGPRARIESVHARPRRYSDRTVVGFFGRRRDATAASPSGAAQLIDTVRTHLQGADEDTVHIVTAIAGLLATVAYADREWSAAEERRVRAELARVNGLEASGVAAILSALQENVVEISTTQTPHYTRDLRALADRDLRLEVLDVLVDLAAADGSISFDEVTLLRNTATALGLTQDDYNAIQDRYRDKLSFLHSS